MENETKYTIHIDRKTLDAELKRRERKKKRDKRKVKMAAWCYRNREWLIALIPVTVAGVTATVKAVSKHSNLQKEEDLKELYCYDRSLGHYWSLKRSLTNDEWLEIKKRKSDGEQLGDILEELKVLK